MNILIDLGSHLMSEALYELLVRSGYERVVVSPANGFAPDVILADSTTLRQDLHSQYPEAKLLLMDAGMETERLCATLLSYPIHGVLSPNTELRLFKKALTAVTQGQVWIDNGSVKSLLRGAGGISPKGRNGHITGREQEIVEYICRGLSNKEIARHLALSENTVKSHLARIFRKLNVTSRSKLIALAVQSQETTGTYRKVFS
jgi:DNA-binding NarL/FixJ family response regulator